MNREKTCFFTGHRSFLPAERPLLEYELKKTVSALCDRGFDRFVCGGALGFDTFAARAVLEISALKEASLHLELPFLGQDAGWSEEDRREYRRILKASDSHEFLYSGYCDGCLLERNRRMVGMSSLCVCWLKKPTGGTAYTVREAQKAGLEIIEIKI